MFKVGDRVRVRRGSIERKTWSGAIYVVKDATPEYCVVSARGAEFSFSNDSLVRVPDQCRIKIAIIGSVVRITQIVNGEETTLPAMKFTSTCEVDICAESIESITCTEPTEEPKPEPTKPPVPEFTIEGFKAGEFAVNCKTEAEARKFLLYLHGMGLAWIGGMPLYRYTNYGTYNSETCYEFRNGVRYCNRVYHILADRAIIDTPDITPKFDLDAFKAGALAVKCHTETETKLFVGYLVGKGMTFEDDVYKMIAWGAMDNPYVYVVNKGGVVCVSYTHEAVTIEFDADEL